MSRSAALLVALALAGVPVRGAAQVSASLLATADVNTTALTISNARNVAFGTIIAGVPRTINPQTSASSGYFLIQGAKRAEITISFTLPAELRAGAGPWTIPLSYGATAGCARNTPNQATCAFFDPATGVVDRIRNQNPPNNHYHVWLGATATPAAGQQAGVYSATVTMMVAYTGN